MLVQMAGDLDYYCKWFNLPRYNNHCKPCSQCRATYVGHNSWLDNRVNSGWQHTLLSVHNWTEHWSSDNPFFEIPGVSALTFSLDYMHNMMLGWPQHFYGSVLFSLFEDCMEGEELERLHYMEKFLKKHQKDHGSRYAFKQRLAKKTMLKPKKGFPKIRGRASDVQSLDHALLALFSAHMLEDNLQHRQIRLFLDLNLQLSKLMEEPGPRYGFPALPAEQARKAFQLGCQMAQLHTMLTNFYKEQGRAIFNQTSKTHFVLHSLMLCWFIHPSMT